MSRNCGHGGLSTLFAKGRPCIRPKNAQILDLAGRSSGGCRIQIIVNGISRDATKERRFGGFMKKTVLAALLSSTLFSVNAMAADVTDIPAPSATSFYIGAQLGGASADVSMTEYDVGTSDESGYTWDGDDTRLLGGVYLGFNYMATETFLIGVEADLGYASLSDESYMDYEGVPDPDEEFLYGWETGLQGSLRARAGLIAGNALLYATGGLAIGQQSFNVYERASSTNFESFDETMVGWTAGGGLEYAFSSNWTARVEYRYTDFGDVTITPSISFLGGRYDQDFEVTQQSIMAGVAYSF
jgi:outer membrane immunogenic protein